MKHINKQAAPRELRDWFKTQPETNRTYEHDITTEVKNIIKQHLLIEQGYLCCYTGIRVTEDNSHIEHLIPQTLCGQRDGNLDVDYNNLLAAYPKDDFANKKFAFGAKFRGDWYHEDKFITPLDRNCENRFRYNLSGKIAPADNNDGAAEKTIKKLGLSNEMLIEYRKAAVHRILYRKKRPISAAALRRIISSYCERDGRDRFRPFCFVIIQAAQELLIKVERKRKQKQYGRKKGK